MILDVQLIKNESIYCKESALATVANWLNRDYRMMFIAMLGFDYTEEGNMTNRKLGERIVSGVSMLDIESTLQYYHGIAVENKMVSNIDEIIVEQIDQKMPVLTYIQPALCEWTREVEGIVFFLVIGYDDSFVYGFDLHSDSSSVEKLLIRDLVKCYTSLNEVQLYKVVSDERMVTIEEIKEAMRKYYDLENTEKKIIKLAEDLSKGYVEEFKSEDGEEFIDLPFFSELIDIVRGKKLFVETCYYIFEKTGDEFAKYIGAKYIDIGEQWNNVWKILVKFYILNSDETDGDNIEEIISEIVECLKNVAKEERKLIKNVLGEAIIKDRIIRVSNKIAEDIGFKYLDVDISGLFDNKAFYDMDSDICADMTGNGEYFQDGVLPDGRAIPIGRTEFCNNVGYDNFACNNQFINVKPGIYKKIYIFGCAEWGSGCGKLQVGNDHYVNTLWLELPDWFFCKMNRINEWSGKSIDYEKNEGERGLFCIDYELNEKEIISWIKFPSVSNMHIFGIKLLYK